MDLFWETVRQGFEPWVPFKGYNALAKRRFRPLSHLTKSGALISSGSRLMARQNQTGGPLFLSEARTGNALSFQVESCFLRGVFPLLSIACFMGGSFIVLTRVLLLGVAALTAQVNRGARKD